MAADQPGGILRRDGDAAVVDNGDLVGVGNSGEPVRYHESRAAPSEPSEPEEESGEGLFTFVDGSRYEGQYATEDGVRRRNGFGTLTQGPETSEGEWVSDKLHGVGRCAFASGATYEGGFEEGVFSGVGTFSWADGAVYVGGWKSGRMHGEGCYTDTDKVEWKGAFHNGSFFNGKAYATLR